MKIGDGTQAALIGAFSGFLAASLGYAVTFGELKSDVKSMGERLRAVEMRFHFNPNEVKKGNLCLKLTESLTDAYRNSLSTRIDDITEQLQKFNCYDGVDAMVAPSSSASGDNN